MSPKPFVPLLCSALVLPGAAQTNNPVPEPAAFPQPYRVEVVAKNLAAPWSLAFLPDRRILFTERFGQVRVIQDGKLLETPALRLTGVAVGVKMGLLGLAIDPGFNTNRFVYLAYNYPLGPDFFMKVVRYRERENRLSQPHTLIDGIPAWLNHTGGRLRFGPEGCLYITTGDANHPPRAQQLESLAGKILRMNPDGSIPQDNPFVGVPGARGEIWSYGHRNPQGIDFDPKRRLVLATEHGPDHGDEVNLIQPGANYGWPTIHHRLTQEGLRSPTLEFTPAIAPASGMFYRGRTFRQLRGDYLVGCLRGEGILRVRLDGTNILGPERWFHRQYGRIREVAESPEGYLYFTTSQQDPPEGQPLPGYDMILRIVPADTPDTGLPVAEILGTRPDATSLAYEPGSTDVSVLIPLFCAPCHGPELAGGMQASLVDAVWKHVTDDASLFRFISDGNADLGMPTFRNSLNAAQIRALIAYIREEEKNLRSNQLLMTPPATDSTDWE